MSLGGWCPDTSQKFDLLPVQEINGKDGVLGCGAKEEQKESLERDHFFYDRERAR
jgi:hypothetical protein